MKTIFAKLYDDPTHGQILVKADVSEEGPEVRFFWKPPQAGICSFSMYFEDSDAGYSDRDEYFVDVDRQLASDLVDEVTRKWSRIISTEMIPSGHNTISIQVHPAG